MKLVLLHGWPHFDGIMGKGDGGDGGE